MLRSNAGSPPEWKKSSIRYSPDGLMFARYGVVREIRSKSSRVKRHSQAAGDGDQVHDGICRPAQRHQRRDRVLERLAGHDARRPQIFMHHLDDPPAA